MKKNIITLIICFVCLHFSFGQCNTQMYDIYTPMGSFVNTWLTCEAATSVREAYDDLYRGRYPDAEMIIVYDGLSSTRKFNCHGYAWLRVEQGIDRWIGYENYEKGTYPDIYIADGSYIEVPSETFPGVVFWDREYDGDHSAITTENPGWFISKWNQYPLFWHRWNNSPYGTATLKYYVRNCSALGNETVNVINRTINMYTPIQSCGNINVQNVIVQNIDTQHNARLILVAPGTVTINPNFKVELGSSLQIK